MSWQSWRHLIPFFSPEIFRLTLMDLRGFGQSDRPPAGYHIDDYMRDAVRLVRALNLGRVTVIGHSFGGTGALYLAARVRHLVDRVIALDTIPGAAAPSIARETRRHFEGLADLLARTQPGKLERVLLRVWRAAFFQSPPPEDVETARAAIRAIAPHVLRETLKTTLTTDIEPWLARIKVPTLLIKGTRDPMLHENPDPLTRIPNHRLVLIPGAGHYPMIENPGLVAHVILTFLGQSAAAGPDAARPFAHPSRDH